MTQHEMLKYLARGFRWAVTVELSCKRCGDFRLLLPENHGEQSACPTCGKSTAIYAITGLCLTNRELPVYSQVKVSKSFLYAVG